MAGEGDGGVRVSPLFHRGGPARNRFSCGPAIKAEILVLRLFSEFPPFLHDPIGPVRAGLTCISCLSDPSGAVKSRSEFNPRLAVGGSMVGNFSRTFTSFAGEPMFSCWMNL